MQIDKLSGINSRHKNLLFVAKITGIVFWFVNVLYLVTIILQIINLTNPQYLSSIHTSTFHTYFSIFVSFLHTFRAWISMGLILKSIEMAIKMIVEMDLNIKRRDKSEAESYE